MSEVSVVLDKLGFWESETEDEHITIYGMGCIILQFLLIFNFFHQPSII